MLRLFGRSKAKTKYFRRFVARKASSARTCVKWPDIMRLTEHVPTVRAFFFVRPQKNFSRTTYGKGLRRDIDIHMLLLPGLPYVTNQAKMYQKQIRLFWMMYCSHRSRRFLFHKESDPWSRHGNGSFQLLSLMKFCLEWNYEFLEDSWSTRIINHDDVFFRRATLSIRLSPRDIATQHIPRESKTSRNATHVFLSRARSWKL